MHHKVVICDTIDCMVNSYIASAVLCRRSVELRSETHMKSMSRGLAAAAVALLAFSGSAAQATQEASDSSDGVPAGVDMTPELKSYLDTLPPAEREQFVNTKLPASEEVTVGPQQPADDAARASVAEAEARGTEVTAAAAGCWTSRYEGEAKALAGNTVFTVYHVGRWCSNGTSVTEASVVDSGGETSTIGWRYEGVVASDARVVNNEGRSYSKFKFVLGAGGWDIQTPTPCLRTKGKADGTTDNDTTCGVY